MNQSEQIEIFDIDIKDLEIIENTDYYFCFKNNKREIEISRDKNKNKIAKKRLEYIFENENNIPKKYIENRQKVLLYDPKGNPENANALVLSLNEGAYSINNKLNDLTGKEWTKFTCSFFTFNALNSDIKQEMEVTMDTQIHPATFSPTMVSEFISFFTKEGDTVIDPFCGIGSTLEACRRTGRIGYGIELNPNYYKIIKKRFPDLEDKIYNMDSRDIDKLDLPKINYSISSPPYWDMLQRSTKNFKKTRLSKNYDFKYSESDLDLGNINDYDEFVKAACEVYIKLYDKLEEGAYITIIVKNVKKGGVLYPLAWDMARELGKIYTLKDEKIWIQDKIALSPYGYPYSWSSNILHHYCLNLRKE